MLESAIYVSYAVKILIEFTLHSDYHQILLMICENIKCIYGKNLVKTTVKGSV